MLTIPLVVLFALTGFFFGKSIRKHNTKLYITASLFAVITFIVRYKIPIIEPFTQGYLGLSLLYIVMITGALKDKALITKKFIGIRREYSILGFILLLPHASKYLIEFLNNEIRFEWFGVISFAIMIPLFITSFMVIRKKFSFGTWKKIQQFAYLAYILIFVHLIIVASMQHTIVYVILFCPYIILKLLKEIKKLKRT